MPLPIDSAELTPAPAARGRYPCDAWLAAALAQPWIVPLGAASRVEGLLANGRVMVLVSDLAGLTDAAARQTVFDALRWGLQTYRGARWRLFERWPTGSGAPEFGGRLGMPQDEVLVG